MEPQLSCCHDWRLNCQICKSDWLPASLDLVTCHPLRSGMPRLSSTVALAALLVLSIIFLIRSSPSQPAYYRDVLSGHGLSLNAWLSREETRYAKVLQERQQLITKWGPTYQSVDP